MSQARVKPFVDVVHQPRYSRPIGGRTSVTGRAGYRQRLGPPVFGTVVAARPIGGRRLFHPVGVDLGARRHWIEIGGIIGAVLECCALAMIGGLRRIIEVTRRYRAIDCRRAANDRGEGFERYACHTGTFDESFDNAARRRLDVDQTPAEAMRRYLQRDGSGRGILPVSPSGPKRKPSPALIAPMAPAVAAASTPKPAAAPNFELDIAPDLVRRGPDDRIDLLPICSLPHEDP